MKAWLVEVALLTLRKLWKGGYRWLLDPQRHARIRFARREFWWRWHQRALQTKDEWDDMLAEAWRIEDGFETSPDKAKERGDLDPKARKLAADAMERNRIASQHGNHP